MSQRSAFGRLADHLGCRLLLEPRLSFRILAKVWRGARRRLCWPHGLRGGCSIHLVVYVYLREPAVDRWGVAKMRFRVERAQCRSTEVSLPIEKPECEAEGGCR